MRRKSRERRTQPFVAPHRPHAGPQAAAPRVQSALVEGRRPVLEALRAGADVKRIRVALSAEPAPTLDEALREAARRHVLVERVEGAALDAQSQTGRHQGIIAEVRPPSALSLEALVARALESGREPLLVVLDGVEDPQNLGAIARSAEAAGAHGLIVPERRSAGISPGSIRASAGALMVLPLAVVPNIPRALEWLRGKGIWIAGADPEGGKPYHDASLTGPLALVVGGEARGLHRLVRERCDFLVSIPLEGRIESLNASAAAAVLLFEAVRQRRAPKPPPPERTKTPK